jgi:hypothetical protein
MLTPLPVEEFGGLDLRNDVTEVGWRGAIDCLNVWVDRRGRLRTRPGYIRTDGSPSPSNNLTTLHRQVGTSTTTTFILATDAGNNLVAYYDEFANTVASTAIASLNENNVVYATIGTPTATYSYVGLGSTSGGATATRKWDGAAWSTPAGVPVASALGVTPWDNRLVTANYNGTNPSRVQFSDAGAPDTFGANNYIDLTPGDGERIAAIKAWRDMLFVFKQTKFFVFYGTSTASTGSPVFNYRTVDAGVGVEPPFLTASQPFQTVNPTARGRDALYFANQFGVYATSGGLPRCVSQAIEPAYRSNAYLASSLPFPAYTGPTMALMATPSIAYVRGNPDDMLYINTAVSSGGAAPTGGFVMNVETNAWMAHDIPFYAMIDVDGLPVFVKGDTHGYRLTELATTDGGTTGQNGSAIVSRYRSGFHAPGGASVESVIRETELTGTGTVTFGWSRDFASSIGLTDSLTLGTTPNSARGYHRKAVRGENLSWQVSATSGAWQLNRVVPALRNERGTGEKTT